MKDCSFWDTYTHTRESQLSNALGIAFYMYLYVDKHQLSNVTAEMSQKIHRRTENRQNSKKKANVIPKA